MRWAAVTLLCFGAACAGMRPVMRPALDSLVLGKSRMPEIAQQYGAPSQVLNLNFRGTPVRVVQYMQAFDPADKPYKPDLYSSRVASFFFVNEVLVGHNFESSFASDNTDFDLSQTDHIKPGQSTREQVTALLGKPVGHYQFPIADEPGLTAVTYLYHETVFTKSGPWQFRKEAIITFDSNDVVASIRYRLGGS